MSPDTTLRAAWQRRLDSGLRDEIHAWRPPRVDVPDEERAAGGVWLAVEVNSGDIGGAGPTPEDAIYAASRGNLEMMLDPDQVFEISDDVLDRPLSWFVLGTTHDAGRLNDVPLSLVRVAGDAAVIYSINEVHEGRGMDVPLEEPAEDPEVAAWAAWLAEHADDVHDWKPEPFDPDVSAVAWAICDGTSMSLHRRTPDEVLQAEADVTRRLLAGGPVALADDFGPCEPGESFGEIIHADRFPARLVQLRGPRELIDRFLGSHAGTVTP